MAFGEVVHHLLGPAAGQPVLYAVVAMGAVFTSAARAPLTSLASVVEADAVVDRTIRPEGLVGYGVLYGRETPPLFCDDSDGVRSKATGLARVHLLETGEAVTGDRDQGLVVRKSRHATSSR